MRRCAQPTHAIQLNFSGQLILILVTGGAGFIGSNFVLEWLAREKSPVTNLDSLTYAGNLENLSQAENDPRLTFVHGDIRDRGLIDKLLRECRPRAIVHFAAESHVDRSIHGPGDFIQTNIVGTFTLIEAVRDYLRHADAAERAQFRFLHVSTDEVYGSLAADSAQSNETSPYAPRSPYSASKAAADHLVRAYIHTYGFPAIVTNCSTIGRNSFAFGKVVVICSCLISAVAKLTNKAFLWLLVRFNFRPAEPWRMIRVPLFCQSLNTGLQISETNLRCFPAASLALPCQGVSPSRQALL